MIKEKNKINFPAYLREPGEQKVSRAFIPQKKKPKVSVNKDLGLKHVRIRI